MIHICSVAYFRSVIGLKIPFNRRNNNREIYLRYHTWYVRGTCSTATFGEHVITPVDFQQFSLYSIGTIIVQGALAGYPSAFHCTLNTQVSYRISYCIVAILSVHPSVTFRCSKKQQTQALRPYLVPFRRYSEILVENRNFFHNPCI